MPIPQHRMIDELMKVPEPYHASDPMYEWREEARPAAFRAMHACEAGGVVSWRPHIRTITGSELDLIRNPVKFIQNVH